MSEIYIVGGEARQNIFKKVEEWQSTNKGYIVRLNTETKKSKKCVEYITPPEARAEDDPAILFKSGYMDGKTLYVCTSTEVMIYELPEFRRTAYISLPRFNDVHHVSPTDRGTFVVVSTGLDMVVELTCSGEVVQEWNVLGQDPWARFSRDIDYRKILTTKPHGAHPNHVFQLDGELWVTRFLQKDAICLTKPGGLIDIKIERPHDGYLFQGSIYFTTVDGHIVIADQKTKQITKIHDLNQMHPEPRQILGWCRGLLPVDERYIWVGFSRVRATKFVENLAWLKNGPPRFKSSHVALYDLKKNECVEEIATEPHGLGVIFSLFSADSQ